MMEQISLQHMVICQAEPLQSMQVSSRVDTHLQPVEDPIPEQMTLRKSHTGAVCHWEEETLIS